jgi:hypothetical protein
METALNSTAHSYRELWNFNLQKIENIQQSIEKSINDLENKYVGFESVYESIAGQIDLLSSIYSNYNAIEGGEYVMRLKSVIASYRKRYTREDLDFDLIHDLLSAIMEKRDRSFERFPYLSHGGREMLVKDRAFSADNCMRKKYRWVTFGRNRSWFIAPFSELVIHRNRNFPVESFEEPDFIFISISGEVLKIKDIFTKFPVWQESPRYYLLLNNMKKNFAADMIGKQIFSDSDITKSIFKPFKRTFSNPFSPGRVRLFGINHLMLY